MRRPLRPDEHVSWETWGNARHVHGAMWRTFLTEQRGLVRGLADLEAGLGAIAVPTLIVADAADKMIPIATSHALHRLIPQAELCIVADGGHNLPRRVPAVLAAEIGRFVDSLD